VRPEKYSRERARFMTDGGVLSPGRTLSTFPPRRPALLRGPPSVQLSAESATGVPEVATKARSRLVAPIGAVQ